MPGRSPRTETLAIRIQVKRASSFRAIVLICTAAACCCDLIKENVEWREGALASPKSTKALTFAHGGACPPQWLPMLLAFNSRHDDGATSSLTALSSTWQCNPAMKNHEIS